MVIKLTEELIHEHKQDTTLLFTLFTVSVIM